MTIPIRVVQGGAYKPVTYVYQKRGGVWKEIVLGQYWYKAPGESAAVAVTVHDRYLLPPVNLRGVSATHNSGLVAWDAHPNANGGYQVVRRTVTYTYSGFAPTRNLGPPVVFPAADTWTNELSMNMVGLAQNSEYQFTVQARRFTSDGTPLYSGESNAVVLKTGYPAVVTQNPSYPGNDVFYIYPSRTDTYTSDHGWGGSSGGPYVIQGRATAAAGTNHWGCVAYATAWSQMNDQLAPYGQHRGSVSINDAYIERIHRMGGGDRGAPNIWFYACAVYFSTQPDIASGLVKVGAPARNGDIYNINMGGWLTSWAAHWIQYSLVPSHNGIVMRRNDGAGNATDGYDGYMTFQNAVGNDVWRLRVYANWQQVTPGVSPAWS